MSLSERQGIHHGCKSELEKLAGHFAEGGALSKNTDLRRRYDQISEDIKGCCDNHGVVRDKADRKTLREIRHRLDQLARDCRSAIVRVQKGTTELHISQSA